MFPVDREQIVWQDGKARTQSLESRGGDVFFVIHHAVARTVDQIVRVFESPDRTVNANFAIGPRTAGEDRYEVWRTYPEDRRAYTTASPIDDKALTCEVANLTLGGSYPVGQTGKRKLAEIAAYMHRAYGMPLDRWHVTCHREVYQRGWGSYATACPGDDLFGSLDWVVEEAKRIVNSGTAGGGQTPIPAPTEEDDMPRNSGVYWSRADGKTEFMVFNAGSGFRANHSGVGMEYNNALAKALDTPDWAKITESHARVIIAAVDAVRSSKASGSLTVDVIEGQP